MPLWVQLWSIAQSIAGYSSKGKDLRLWASRDKKLMKIRCSQTSLWGLSWAGVGWWCCSCYIGSCLSCAVDSRTGPSTSGGGSTECSRGAQCLRCPCCRKSAQDMPSSVLWVHSSGSCTAFHSPRMESVQQNFSIKFVEEHRALSKVSQMLQQLWHSLNDWILMTN